MEISGVLRRGRIAVRAAMAVRSAIAVRSAMAVGCSTNCGNGVGGMRKGLMRRLLWSRAASIRQFEDDRCLNHSGDDTWTGTGGVLAAAGQIRAAWAHGARATCTSGSRSHAAGVELDSTSQINRDSLGGASRGCNYGAPSLLRDVIQNVEKGRTESRPGGHGGLSPARLGAFIGALCALQAATMEKVESQRDAEPSVENPHVIRVPQSLISDLQSTLGEDGVVTDEDECESHAKPWNSYHQSTARPDAVVYPRSTEDVASIIKACSRHKVPLIPYGGGTSIEGHTTTPRGGVSIDMNLMKEVKRLSVEDMDITVEPGIGWIELNEFLLPYGLFFPLDPGPGASIGGMCATRCSGSLAVRYGTMRDNVISIKAVLANGDVVKTAARARKTAAGYDLTHLFIGSEGTLGVITEVTLKLQRIPEASAVAMCTFSSIKEAADVAIATMHSGFKVSRVELLDEVMMKAINLATGRSLPEKPTLMFEFIGSEAYVKEQTEHAERIVSSGGGSNFVFARSAEEKESLWKARKEALWSASSLRPDAEAMITDVCVPLSRLAECINETKKELDASHLPCPIVSHAGDGNFHVIIMLDPSDPRDMEEANRLSSNMTYRAIAMDGTCTGEHGVGVGKIKYLEKELGVEAVKMMATLKRALDPDNIMNPGKVLPKHYCC